ncbi:MAG: sterol desaturase family protein [Sphingorhabdus sp.]|uniref:sterol desaturase family protein n=1 Tax=Sphingorhabdus sp. TaxID=1902408 RepID=UPI003C9F995D
MGDNGTKLVALMPAVVFVLIALLETMQPRRALRFGRLRRWTTSLILFVCNRATVLLLAWIIAVPAAAFWAETKGIGLFNQIALPLWAEWLSAFLLLDFAMWLQHRLTHKVPLLWRFHKVHHADPDIDVSTAIRFHPGEIAFSVLWKTGWVLLLGFSAPIIIAFEAWLAANAAFNHGNIELPRWLDRIVRLCLVTPDMHLVHHSVIMREQQSNYGFALTIWDRLFGTYVDESENGRHLQSIGLADMQDARPSHAGISLKLPLT